MSTALYARVSTTRQEEGGVSLETQREVMRAYCKAKGFNHTKEYVDVGSARSTDRENYQIMMRDVRNGKIKNIVIYRLDRLNRSNLDLLKLVEELNKHNCGFHSTSENIDTSSASGKLQINMIGAIAEHESNVISERVIINMDSLASQGVWMSKEPYGFVKGSDRRLKVYEDEAKYLREAFDLMLKGESATNATKIMNSRHSLNWTMEFLRVKIYTQSLIGNIYRKGKIHENTHEGIITENEQETLISLLKSKKRTHLGFNHIDLFRRKLQCPQCDSTLTMAFSKGKNGNDNTYYYVCNSCRDGNRPFLSAAETKIEEVLLESINNATLSNFKEPIEATNNADINQKLDEMRKEKDNIQRAWIKNLMSDDDLIKYQKELEEREIYLKKKLRIDKPKIDFSHIQKTFKVLYESLTKEEKRDFIQMHFKRIYFERNKLDNGRYKYKVTQVEFM